MKKIHIWSDKEKEYLKEITPGRHYKEIVDLMNKKFDYQFTVDQIKGALNRYKLKTGLGGHFPKGNIPWNKGKKGICAKGCENTWFKKGEKPPNWVPLGTERISKDGYIEVKIQDGKLNENWRGKHIVIWEKYNGSVPAGHAVIFGDRNNRNFAINNLILVSRKQLLILNSNKLIKNDADLTRTGVMIADLQIKINERRK